MNLSPSMEILQHKNITTKDASVPTVTQIGEVIFNGAPSNPFMVGLQEFHLKMEKNYKHMIVDLDMVKSTNNKYQRIGRHKRGRPIQGTWILLSPGIWCRSTQIKNVHMPISHYQASILRKLTGGVYLGICIGPCGVSLPYYILFWNSL